MYIRPRIVDVLDTRKYVTSAESSYVSIFCLWLLVENGVSALRQKSGRLSKIRSDDAPKLIMAPPQRVLVSYSGAQAFLSSGSWDQIHTALLAQLPLRNIHWKSPSRPSIRTIQELDISLVPLESLRDEHTSQIPATLLEKPFLNMYIVTCEVARTNLCYRNASNISTRGYRLGDLQDLDQASGQRVALCRYFSKEPRVAYSPHRPARFPDSEWKFLPAEGFCFRQAER